jgi:hypothetical protein
MADNTEEPRRVRVVRRATVGSADATGRSRAGSSASRPLTFLGETSPAVSMLRQSARLPVTPEVPETPATPGRQGGPVVGQDYVTASSSNAPHYARQLRPRRSTVSQSLHNQFYATPEGQALRVLRAEETSSSSDSAQRPSSSPQVTPSTAPAVSTGRPTSRGRSSRRRLSAPPLLSNAQPTPIGGNYEGLEDVEEDNVRSDILDVVDPSVSTAADLSSIGSSICIPYVSRPVTRHHHC